MADMVFDEIPTDLQVPGTYIETKANYSNQRIEDYPVKNLIIGGILPEGSLAEGQIIEVVNAEEAISLFGAGSTGAQMVEAFRKANSLQPLFVTGLKDQDTATKAQGSLSFVGTLTHAQTLHFKIAGRPLQFTVAVGDEVKQIADKFLSAFNKLENLPITATSADGVITFSAMHKGAIGNDIDLRLDHGQGSLPQGLSVSIEKMSGGAGNPNIEEALDIIGNSWFTAITMPWSDEQNLQTLSQFLDEAFKAQEKRDCVAYVAKSCGFSDAISYGDATNCKFLSFLPLSKSPSPSWCVGATAMAVAEYYLAEDPARQLGNLVLPNIEAPADKDRWDLAENQLALQHGCSIFKATAQGALSFARVITTYNQTEQGVNTDKWLDIMVPKTLSHIRYDWASYLSKLYPRAKLADDNSAAALAAGSNSLGNIVTPAKIKGSWAGRCQLYAENGWIEDLESNLQKSSVERSSNDKNRVNSRFFLTIVGNLMVFAGGLEFNA